MSQSAGNAAEQPVLLRRDEAGIVRLTLNRPDKCNALSDALLTALAEAVADIRANPADLRCVVIGAAGKAFCAGHDLKEMRGQPDQAYYQDLFTRCSRLMRSLRELPQPIIARVQGMATAAGCQLVAACDLAVAAEQATFATNGIDHGLFCATPSVPLSRNIATKNAFEMLFTGAFVSAGQAQDWGLVNRVVPAAGLDAAVADFTDRIKRKAPASVAAGKRLFYAQRERTEAEAYDLATEHIACDLMGPEAAEGIDAFLEKREPAWRQG